MFNMNEDILSDKMKLVNDDHWFWCLESNVDYDQHLRLMLMSLVCIYLENKPNSFWSDDGGRRKLTETPPVGNINILT